MFFFKLFYWSSLIDLSRYCRLLLNEKNANFLLVSINLKKRQLKELPLLAKIIMQTSMLQEAMADTRDFDYDDIDPDRFLAEAIKARH